MNNKIIEEAYLESRENYFEFFECSIPDSRILDVEELLHLFAVPDKEYDRWDFDIESSTEQFFGELPGYLTGPLLPEER